jgi:hypothetical protein
MLFKGYRYQVMLDNPIFSKDLMYGVPSIYNQLRDSITDDIPPMIFQQSGSSWGGPDGNRMRQSNNVS